MTTIESGRERLKPFLYDAWCFIASALTLCFGGALTIAGGVGGMFAAIMLSLPDKVLLEHSGRPVGEQRIALVIVLGVGVVLLIWGLLVLKDWQQLRSVAALLDRLPNQHAHRVAELEGELRVAVRFAEEAESAFDTLAAVEEVFSIEGVLDAARKAARKALHHDTRPGASESETRDLTERFQRADALFDSFAS